MMTKTGIKNIILLSLLVFLPLFLIGCQKDSINGHLDGRWQIMEIETDGEVNEVKDQQLYYNFYMHVCNLSFYGGVFAEANFILENNIIYLSFPYINTPDRFESLSNYGIYSNPVEFRVVYLDKKKLIMENDESIITCRKF